MLWPSAEERRHLGPFFAATFVGECLNVVLPFQFLYLLLALGDDPAHAGLVLALGAASVLVFEVPTGAVADRFGRKRSVILGDLVQGAAVAAVPLAALSPDAWRLPLLGALFVLHGFGETLVSGAEDAWVCDNLEAEGRSDLAARWFARENSVASLAGLVAGVLATTVAVISLGAPSAGLLHGFWVAAGLGQIASALVLLPVPELELADPERDGDSEDDEDGGEDDGVLVETGRALQIVGRSPALRGVMAFSALSLLAYAAMGEAFDVALFVRAAPLWVFPALWLAKDAVGVVAPLLSPWCVERVGARGLLAAAVLAPAALAALLFAAPGLAAVLGIALVFAVFGELAGPAVDTRLMALSPSRSRATLGSFTSQLEHLAEALSLGLFALVLDLGGSDLSDCLPDLADAFRPGGAAAVAPGGTGVADAAVLTLVAVSLLSLVALRGDAFGGGAARRDRTADNQANRAEALTAAQAVQRELERLNPGEELSWWVAARPFRLPAHTLDTLRALGPPIARFFPAARAVASRHAWVRELVEKRFHPVYARLNDAQSDRYPVLIRPDVVPDAAWNPRVVELEITVAGRADVGAMAAAYGLPRDRGTAAETVRWLRAAGYGDATVALLTAPHPFFQDLLDDARGWATLLRDHGQDVVVLDEDELLGLRFDGRALTLTGPEGDVREIAMIDRFVDIYEIAELQHEGIGAVRDAFLAGAVRDLNSCHQLLDEKLWMALLHDARLDRDWEEFLGTADLRALRAAVLPTYVVAAGVTVPVGARQVRVEDLRGVPAAERRYVLKESGTSTTASGAQSFHVLSRMDDADVARRIGEILERGPAHVLQPLVESPRIAFDAADLDDPGRPAVRHQDAARVKLSPFYVDGVLTDVRFVASDRRYAVNDEDYVCGVVDLSPE